MMREIPSLQTLCFRAVGSHACSAEDTFCPDTQTKRTSTASRLLRSFHARPVGSLDEFAETIKNKNNQQEQEQEQQQHQLSLQDVPLERIPCIGPIRRFNTNTVDLHHPFTGERITNKDNNNSKTTTSILVSQYNNPALDVLQAYIDSLVELGRMDDTRLGRHFFKEFLANIPSANGAVTPEIETPKPTKKRQRRNSSNSGRNSVTPPPPFDRTKMVSLSLYHCSISVDTLEALHESGLGPHLAVLDLTGVQGLTDDLCHSLLKDCCHLQRLSLKNGRRFTCASLQALVDHDNSQLASLDVGGCYNIKAADLVHKIVAYLPALVELHAGGLGWTDVELGDLMQTRTQPLQALSLGFSGKSAISNGLTAPLFRQHLLVKNFNQTLISLALPFCESLVDNALMGMMGRNLPALKFLDARGNPALYTVTGWYDGRASADLPVQAFTVLARYSGISNNSVEETKRVHPLESLQLTVVLDGEGTGLAIPQRTCTNK